MLVRRRVQETEGVGRGEEVCALGIGEVEEKEDLGVVRGGGARTFGRNGMMG